MDITQDSNCRLTFEFLHKILNGTRALCINNARKPNETIENVEAVQTEKEFHESFVFHMSRTDFTVK